MTSSTGTESRIGRRFQWLAIGIVLAIALYSAGWYYLSQRFLAGTQDFLGELRAEGLTAECTNAEARGYPFRIGLFCDSVSFADPDQGVRVEAGALRSAAQVYDPSLIVAELDSPASLSTPDTGELQLAWENLRASTKLSDPLPQRASVEGREVRIEQAGAPLLTLGTGVGHVRNREGDLDMAASFDALRLDALLPAASEAPPLNGTVDLTVANGVAWAAAGARSLRGVEGTLRALSLTAGDDGSLALAGPFSIDENGLLDATLTVSIRNPAELAEVAAALFPDAGEQIRSSLSGLGLVSEASSLPLSIEDGEVRLAFFTLGEIPPLD